MVVKDLQVLKTFTTEAPVNSAAILPGKPYVRRMPNRTSVDQSDLLIGFQGLGWWWARGDGCHHNVCTAGPL